MRRRLFTLAAAISLLLCAALVVLWVPSRGKFLQVAGLGPGQAYWVARSDEWGLHIERVAGFDPAGSVPLFSHGPLLEYRPVFGVTTTPPVASARRLPGMFIADGATDITYREDGVPASLKEQFSPGVFLTGGPAYPYWAVNLTHTTAFTLFSLLPLVWFVRHLMRRRERHARRTHNRCVFCGYSLTGNTSGICPECGSPVPQKAESKA